MRCRARAPDDEAVEGPLMAFKKGDERVLVHQACASCSSEVYFDMQSRLCNVLKAVKRGRGLKCAAGRKCSRPKKSGATAGCSVASCKRSYHVRCCLDTGWTFGPNKTFFCPVHRRANYDPKDVRGLVDVRLCLRPEGPELRRRHGHVGVASAGRGSTPRARAAPRTRRGARRLRALPLPRHRGRPHPSPSPIA